MNKIYIFQPFYFRFFLILLYLLRLVFHMVFYFQVYWWKGLVFFIYIFWHASFMHCQSCPALSHHCNHVNQEVPFTKLVSVQLLPPHVHYPLSTVFSLSPAGVIIWVSYFSRHGLDRQGMFEDSVLVGSSLYASLQFSSFIDGYNNGHI